MMIIIIVRPKESASACELELALASGSGKQGCQTQLESTRVRPGCDGRSWT